MRFGSLKIFASQEQVSYQDGNNPMVYVDDTEGFSVNGKQSTQFYLFCLIYKINF
jgi:hypothetical protein